MLIAFQTYNVMITNLIIDSVVLKDKHLTLIFVRTILFVTIVFFFLWKHFFCLIHFREQKLVRVGEPSCAPRIVKKRHVYPIEWELLTLQLF